MIVFPNCKINLGLHILSKRADGFHNIETIFYPIPLQDALEVVSQEGRNKIAFFVTGMPVDIPAEDNICVKAYRLLQTDFPSLPAVQMHLHKAIPSGAGLGGGSADGAFSLLLLNKKFNLNLTQSQLLRYATMLGSDCAFFIKNKPCHASGKGELLEEISLDLSQYKLIVVNPSIHVATGWAFSQLTPKVNRVSLKEVIQTPVQNWKENLSNDFESPLFKKYPAIEEIKKSLYQQGALYASMSGSGSSVYGIFEKEVAPLLSYPPHYFIKEFN